jgi:hypothetical protein
MKSTINTSRKIYAMKHGMQHVTGIVILYVFCIAIKLEVDSNVFLSAIGAATLIISALNLADGIKGHEKEGNDG